MLRSIFFRRREPRKFNYKPRFYDPRKEEQEQRVERIKQELGMTDDTQESNPQSYSERIKGTFANERKHLKSRTIFDLITSKRIRMIVRVFSVLLIVIMGYLLSVGLKTIFYAHEAKKDSKQVESQKKQDENIFEEDYTNIIIEDE